jgi:hypothetical protein
MHRYAVWARRRSRPGGGVLDNAERQSRTRVVRARASHLGISNRHFLARLENAVTHGKQTPKVDSNRHFWEGVCEIFDDSAAQATEYFRASGTVQIADFFVGA